MAPETVQYKTTYVKINTYSSTVQKVITYLQAVVCADMPEQILIVRMSGPLVDALVIAL